MKRATFIVAAVLLALASAARADFVFNSGFPNGVAIPDGPMTGWADTRTLSGLPTGPITDVRVGLNLSGSWNGDLYAYLVHDNTAAVLLNRVGMGNGGAYNASGYGASGMNVILSDAGLLNIHDVSLPVSGETYQPDGRNISPLSSVSLFSVTTPTALLSAFNGGSANGNWTLFIADVSGGDQSAVQSWSLEIAAVPEPASVVEGGVAVLFLGGVMGLYRRHRTRTGTT
jgi:hypothetical protein